MRFFIKWAALIAGVLLFGTHSVLAFRFSMQSVGMIEALVSMFLFVIAGGITGGLVAVAVRLACQSEGK